MEVLFALCRQYKWRIIGVLGGILLCILMFTIGFWRTLLLAVVVSLCYWGGTLLDEGGRERLGECIARLFQKK